MKQETQSWVKVTPVETGEFCIQSCVHSAAACIGNHTCDSAGSEQEVSPTVREHNSF